MLWQLSNQSLTNQFISENTVYGHKDNDVQPTNATVCQSKHLQKPSKMQTRCTKMSNIFLPKNVRQVQC